MYTISFPISAHRRSSTLQANLSGATVKRLFSAHPVGHPVRRHTLVPEVPGSNPADGKIFLKNLNLLMI